MYHSKLTNEQLIDVLISYAETAYYSHDSTEQEEAKLELSIIKRIMLDRMKSKH